MPKPKSPAMFTRRTRRERMGLNPSEHTEAVRFMRVVRLHEPKHPALRWLYAIPLSSHSVVTTGRYPLRSERRSFPRSSSDVGGQSQARRQ